MVAAVEKSSIGTLELRKQLIEKMEKQWNGSFALTGQRNLIFSEQNEYYASARRMVVFTGRDGDKIIQCAISDEALADHFDGNEKNLLKVFQTNRSSIEHEARRKYLAGNFEADGSILLSTGDIE